MRDLRLFQKAVRDEGCSGWLFYNYKHRDSLADRLLGMNPAAINTRPWIYFIPAEGEPVKINHLIEADALGHLLGKRCLYSSGEDLRDAVRGCIAPSMRTEEPNTAGTFSGDRTARGKIAVHISSEIPAFSFLDHGAATMLISCGLELTSAAGCVQRTAGVVTPEGAASHRRAAEHLYEIVASVWDRIGADFGKIPIFEGDVRSWISYEFAMRGLVTDHPPIVAAGPHSADPHYEPDGKGSELLRGQVVQFDLWAKEKGADENAETVFADISWVGVLNDSPDPKQLLLFDTVAGARDLAVSYIRERSINLTGAEVDEKVRSFVEERGMGGELRHRTGHGIDTECHGVGVNIDSVEFPDHRKIIEGSCFSIEPGLYLEDFGMRTEINVLIENGAPAVTGGPVQRKLLTL